MQPCSSYFFSLFAIVLIDIVLSTQINFPETPCKNVFQYKRVKGKNVGYIKKKYEGEASVRLSLHVTSTRVGQKPEEPSVRSLTPLDGIKKGGDLRWKVEFPSQDVPPIVDSIKLNGKEICAK